MDRKALDPSPRQVWAEFLISRALVFMISQANHGDMRAYFDGVSRLVARGTPYGEEGFGYPALAFLFVSIPWLLGGRKFDVYYPLYRAQCFSIDILLFLLMSRRLSRPALLVYILCTTMLANLLHSRLDIALGCMLAFALILEARDSWKPAGVVLGASIAFKIIPVLLLPCWLSWSLRGSLKKAFGSLGFIVLGAGIPIGIGWLLWGKQALFFMGAHAGRGVQIESIWASIQMALMEFGLHGETYFGTGSYNLSTPLEGVFKTASHITGIAASLWGGLLAVRLARRGGPLVLATSGTLGALMLASKVFSPQFLLFFLPLLSWSFDSMSPGYRRTSMALAVSVCALTTWIYPYHEQELVALSGVATVPLAARNALFAVLVILLQVQAWRWRKAEL
jgi:hypothetical protein